MALDGKILSRARQRLDDNRKNRQLELNRRTAEVYRNVPAIQELDDMIRATAAAAITAAISGEEDTITAIENMSRDNLRFQEEREVELLLAGYPKDYLDDGYACPDCRDTGFIGSTPCHCLMELYDREQEKELDALFPEKESFDTFNLLRYQDGPNGYVDSVRENMEIVYDVCVHYATKFDKHKNLLLYGPSGSGKTYMAGCIARAVAQSGHWVIYQSAGTAFSLFEKEKFSRFEDAETAGNETRRLFACDLLILDDLGMEMTTAFTNSVLFDLVNRRLREGKRTVICTNLSQAQLEQRYTPQILSRIVGQYEVLSFSGERLNVP